MGLCRSVTFALLLGVPAVAQLHKSQDASARGGERATVVHVASVYTAADSADPSIASVTPGHEVVVNNKNGPWLSVFANTDEKEEDPDNKPEFTDLNTQAQPSSGWIRDKGVVGPKTPQGDLILFGTAADLESQAAEPHAPKGAAESASLLYRRVWEYYPESSLAGEAAFRSADIRWQLDKADISTLPSAHEQEAFLRPQIYEGQLKRVIKNYPNSPVAAKATFDLLDNKLCGDWQGLPKCPEMETTLYTKYADHFPGGPKSAEALFDAVYRQGALVTMYLVDDNRKRSEQAAGNCEALADRMLQEYPLSDFTDRAKSIAYRVKQGVSVYGSDRD